MKRAKLLGALALAALVFGVPAAIVASTLPPRETHLPERLADTGLYSEFATREIAPGILAFEPQYPLWSDGAAKKRWIHLPRGKAIDASNPDAWVFPIGTKLWKEFAFERRVETRFMERGADGKWIYASYQWSADESDARLAPERGVTRACETPTGASFDIPSRMDCLACHQGGASEVLGFSALQLSPDRDPLAPHAKTPAPDAVDLHDLIERKSIRHLPNQLIERAPRIEAPTPRARAALGYLHGNCGMCHNSVGTLASLGMELNVHVAPPSAPATATVLDVPSHFQLAAGVEDVRALGGEPERSVLARRMASRNPLVQMPPLGTHDVDAEALALISDWIREDLSSPQAVASSTPSSSQD